VRVSPQEHSALLERNLRALAHAGSDLAERLTWPMLGTHLARSPAGQLLRKGMPISLPAEEVQATAEEIAGDGPLALLGLGDAELIAPLLEQSEHPLIVWERDPWVVRSALATHDFSEALASGRLSLALGVDLLELLARKPAPRFAWHPLARASYALEAELVSSASAGLPERVVALGVDRLLCDELAAALRAEGYAVVPIDLEGWSLEELERALARTRPEFVASINYVWGLAEFCGARGVRQLCWEIDPSTEVLPRVTGDTSHCAVFSYRRAHVETFRRAGFARVEHLPLAADPERRRPLELSPEERARFGAPLAFVGSSLAPEARRARRRLDELLAAEPPAPRAVLAAALERALARQRTDFARYTLEAELGPELGAFVAALRSRGEREDPLALAAQIAAAEKRLCYLRALAGSGIAELDVWGDDGWAELAGSGARHRGYAGHRHELTRIYAGADINVDIGRLYQSDIVTLRVFDVLACRGFLIAEHGAELAELFEIGVELESYRDLPELIDKVRHYAARPDARRAIAERGRRAVERRHTVRARTRAMLEVLPTLRSP
jgi:spore maturation protein CgeB